MSPSLTVKAPCGVLTDNSEASLSPSSHTMTPLATTPGSCRAAPPNNRIGCVEMRHWFPVMASPPSKRQGSRETIRAPRAETPPSHLVVALSERPSRTRTPTAAWAAGVSAMRSKSEVRRDILSDPLVCYLPLQLAHPCAPGEPDPRHDDGCAQRDDHCKPKLRRALL